MSIDFEGLRNAANKGRQYLKDEEEKQRKYEEDRIKKINEEVRKECAIIKQDFIKLLNTEIKNDIEHGQISIWKSQRVKANNIFLRAKENNVKEILLFEECDDFFDKQFEKTLKDRANIIFSPAQKPQLFDEGFNKYTLFYILNVIK